MENIEKLYKEWQRVQPLKKDDQERLDEKFMLEFNYNSNHIEGNTLTYGQTKLLLMFDKTTGTASMRDYQEMKAHNVGLELMKREALDKERPLTEAFIRELNRVIQVENYHKVSRDGQSSYEIHVGEYKTRPNSVMTAAGVEFHYASPEETPALMAQLVTWYIETEKNGNINPVELAAVFHYRFIRIHPFEDGNGRVARLLMNYILLRQGYPMIIIKSNDKNAYLDALNLADIEVGTTPSHGANANFEAVSPFTNYIREQAKYALEISIKAAKGEDIEEEDDFEKQLTLLKREAKQKSNIEKNKLTFNSNEVWNVLEYCFFPITIEISKAFKPAREFFHQVTAYNLLSKSTHRSNGLHINSVQRDGSNSQVNDYISNAKRMFYVYELKYGKQDFFKTSDFCVDEVFDITFNEKNYNVHYLNKPELTYDYGTYPDEATMSEIISLYKQNLLKKIDKAIIK